MTSPSFAAAVPARSADPASAQAQPSFNTDPMRYPPVVALRAKGRGAAAARFFGLDREYDRGGVRMRAAYHAELQGLETTLREEADLVLQSLRAVLDALQRQDVALADEVVGFDDSVDRLYIAIEKGIESLLARQTPVAGDLRLVLAVLHINRHLERMGDQCVTIAKLTRLTAYLPADESLLAILQEMGARAEQMTRAAVESLIRRDGASA